MACRPNYTSSNICNSSKERSVIDVKRVESSLLIVYSDKTTSLVSMKSCCADGTVNPPPLRPSVTNKTINFVNATGKLPVATVLVP